MNATPTKRIIKVKLGESVPATATLVKIEKVTEVKQSENEWEYRCRTGFGWGVERIPRKIIKEVEYAYYEVLDFV